MKVAWKDVACPVCGQSPGWACRTATSPPRPRQTHPERYQAARAAVVTIDGLLHVDPEPGGSQP